MPPSAVRFTPQLVSALQRFDDGERSIAEINRLIGELAETIGMQRPSYESVRTHVHQRRGYPRLGPSRADVLFDVAMGVRSPRELADWRPGRDLPEDAGLHPERYRK